MKDLEKAANRPWQQIECPVCGELARAEPPRKPWVGLTGKEKREARNSVSYSPLAMTMSEWSEAVQDATEAKLKEKNT